MNIKPGIYLALLFCIISCNSTKTAKNVFINLDNYTINGFKRGDSLNFIKNKNNGCSEYQEFDGSTLENCKSNGIKFYFSKNGLFNASIKVNKDLINVYFVRKNKKYVIPVKSGFKEVVDVAYNLGMVKNKDEFKQLKSENYYSERFYYSSEEIKLQIVVDRDDIYLYIYFY